MPLAIEKWDTPEGDGNLERLHIWLQEYWEMRYPGRGRKLVDGIDVVKAKNVLRNEIPRKGTETSVTSNSQTPFLLLRNEIPRKGTETSTWEAVTFAPIYWEMRYPGRGRKRLFGRRLDDMKQLRNEIPRKGTETQFHSIIRHNTSIEKWDTPEGDGNGFNIHHINHSVDWEMRYPGRGRKLGIGD